MTHFLSRRKIFKDFADCKCLAFEIFHDDGILSKFISCQNFFFSSLENLCLENKAHIGWIVGLISFHDYGASVKLSSHAHAHTHAHARTHHTHTP